MKDLTEGSIYKNFIVFAMPLLLTGFLLQIFGAVDTAIASNFLGDNAVAAMEATAPLIELLNSAIWGYSIGFSIYIAKLFGSKQFDKIKNTFYSVLLLSSLVVALLLLGLFLARNAVITLLNVNESVKKEATVYFSIYCFTLMLMMWRNFFTFALHALGDTVYPLFISIISSVLHIGCSLLFILAIKGRLASVAGLALSNSISIIIACALLFVKIIRYIKQFPSNTPFCFESRCMRTVFAYALPPMLQQIIMYASGLLISPIINGLAVVQLSAYSVSNKIRVVTEQAFTSSSKAVSNYTAQSIGARKYENIKRGVKAGLLQGALTLLPIVLICIIFSKSIAGIFYSGEGETQSFHYVVAYLRFCVPFFFFNVVNNLFHAFFRGIKATRYLLLITTVGSLSKYAFTLLFFAKYGIYGVWLAIIVAWILEAILCGVLYFAGVWKKYTEEPCEASNKQKM